MLASTRISLTYNVLAFVIFVLAGVLAYLIWSYQPVPNTLGEVLRPIGLAFVVVAGLIQVCATAANPLAKRVVRALRSKSL